MGDRLLLRRSTVNYFSKPPPELSHRLGLDGAHLGDGQSEPFADDPTRHRDGQRIAETEAHGLQRKGHSRRLSPPPMG